MKVEFRKLDKLAVNPGNARLHGDAQVAEIARSIKRFGFVNPVLLDARGQVIAGHGRMLAARRLGLNEVPVIILENLTEMQARALALADNRIALNSGWDEQLLRDELEHLKVAGEAIDDLGFDTAELYRLFEDGDGVDVKKIETGPVSDVFWISVRGPLKDQAIVISRLQTALVGMPDVELEIGTIGLD